ncbi:MAG: hypothetical protein GF334_02585 [Candidatus Altiarchaeales archaeon]|nr:hypothetical protein [Candidatus Altiarchaeales archaeon]
MDKERRQKLLELEPGDTDLVRELLHENAREGKGRRVCYNCLKEFSDDHCGLNVSLTEWYCSPFCNGYVEEDHLAVCEAREWWGDLHCSCEERKRISLKLSDCERRRIYKVRGKSIRVGIFDGKTGFYGIFSLNYHPYFDTEQHWENGGQLEVVRPLWMLPEEYDLTDNEPLFDYLTTNYTLGPLVYASPP